MLLPVACVEGAIVSMRLLLELLLLASDLSGYPVPAELPTVAIVAPEEMPCACRGAHVRGQVWIDTTLALDRPFGRSVLVHEFTHFLQEQALGNGNAGEQARRETEVVGVQNRYLSFQGVAVRAASWSSDE